MTEAQVDIRPKDIEIVRSILRRNLPEDASVWVFGSRAQGKARRGADLDLALDAGRPLSKSESYALADAFEQSDLPYTVDVVDLRTVTESFKAIIEAEKVLLP